MQRTFPSPNPARLRVEIPSGRIRVIATDTAETTIDLVASDARAQAWIDDAEIGQSGDEIYVVVRKHGLVVFGFGGHIDATFRVPTASAAKLSTGSGKIETEGRLGDVWAASGSGAVRLADCAEVKARTGSGEIVIGSATGSADAKTGSGRVTLGQIGGDAHVTTGSGHAELAGAVGDARLTTGSGNIEIGQAGDSLEAFAASGHVRIGRADHGRVRAKTVSGHVRVGVAKGAAAWLDIHTMSGRVKSELDSTGAPGPDETSVELRIETMSGNVDVVRA